MKISETLYKAADLLEQNGVCKGSFYRIGPYGETRYCTLGAIREVVQYYYPRSAIRFLSEFIREEFGSPTVDGFKTVAGFNDNRNRKPATIIRTVRRAAAKAEAEGK